MRFGCACGRFRRVCRRHSIASFGVHSSGFIARLLLTHNRHTGRPLVLHRLVPQRLSAIGARVRVGAIDDALARVESITFALASEISRSDGFFV
jgi:hypothetical protein